MANEKLEIDVIVNGKKAKTQLNQVDNKVKEVGKSAKATAAIMSSSWIKIGATIAATVLSIKKMSDAYAVQLKAEVQLQNALKINAQAGENNLEVWKEYASALQGITTTGDELILSQVSLLKSMGMTDDKTKSIIETALDLSAAFGLDMKSSVIGLTNTMEGNASVLDRYLPFLKSLDKESKKAGKGFDLVAEAVKGQAQAWAETGQGGLTQASNSFGDIIEKGGQVFTMFGEKTGVIGAIVDLFDSMNNKLSGLITSFKSINELDSNERDQRRLEILDQIKKKEDDIANASSFLGNKGKYEAELRALNSKLALLDSVEIKEKEQIQALNKLKEEQQAKEAALAAQKKLNKQEELSDMEALKEAEAEFDALDDLYLEKDKERTAKKKALDDEMQASNEKMASAMADSITQFVMTGKGSFEDFAKSVIAQLVKIQIQQSIVNALSGTTIGSFLGYHTGTTQVKHSGGSITGHIPSHHNGSMRSDERIAKLQVGEAVVNRAGASQNKAAIAAMNAGYSVGGGSGVTVNIENNSGVPMSADMVSSGGSDDQKTIQIVVNGISKNTMGIRDMLKGMK